VGATMTRGEVVWDVFAFSYPAFEVFVAGQEMMVEAASTTSMRNGRSLIRLCLCAGCRVLVKAGGSKLSFGDKKLEMTYGYTRHHQHPRRFLLEGLTQELL
jgi:hypothetical protein